MISKEFPDVTFRYRIQGETMMLDPLNIPAGCTTFRAAGASQSPTPVRDGSASGNGSPLSSAEPDTQLSQHAPSQPDPPPMFLRGLYRDFVPDLIARSVCGLFSQRRRGLTDRD